MADDLVDEASSAQDAQHWISKLADFLILRYKKAEDADALIDSFPHKARPPLRQLPTDIVSSSPLVELLQGFELDLEFEKKNFPIATEIELEEYRNHVAGTVAELIVQLVLHHNPAQLYPEQRKRVFAAARQMGIALQYVNIARDIAADARNGRVYLPSNWLTEVGLSPDENIKKPANPATELLSLRGRLLGKAFLLSERRAVDDLPPDVRGPMTVAVECYMEIGRMLHKERYDCESLKNRAKVPLTRRLLLAWVTMWKVGLKKGTATTYGK